jgi:hypothetical protein
MRHFRKLSIVAAFVFGGLAMATFAISHEAPKQSDNWLLDVQDDTERFKRIQQMFGGFSAAMQIVGERYDRTYDAVAEGNYELANYHWKKIKEAIELGYLRRPSREANSVDLFLNDSWTSASEAFASKEKDKARDGFLSARSACLACHLAEKVPYMNDQPKFRRTAKFPEP